MRDRPGGQIGLDGGALTPTRGARTGPIVALSLTSTLLALGLGACSGPQGEERRSESRSNAALDERLANASPAAGSAIFRQCAACHVMGQGAGDRDGPNLYNVLGKRVGHASDRFGTTAALRGLGGTWTLERMDAWLQNPKQLVPGTRMAFPGLPNGVDRADVIAFLNENGSRLPLPKKP
jgi:cytochrome c